MSGGKNILFEKFEILDCLKKDDGAAVYVAFHIFLGKKILLKTLDQSRITDPAMLKRFQREAKTLARLDHRNIITVYDFGTFDSFFYISFEYFPSRNLRQVIDDSMLDEQQKKKIFRQILVGVDFAHQHKIIHRDLKPENILVDSNGRVKVADFGLALIEDEESLTVQTSIVGTPSYMSPEQIRGEELTAQSDVFSLGVIGYELFTGRNPFLGKDAGSTLHNILASESTLPELEQIPEPERGLIESMLLKSKKERLASVAEALEQLGVQQTQAAEHLRPPERRRFGRLAVSIAIAALLIMSLLVWQRSREKPNTAENDMSSPDSLAAAENETATPSSFADDSSKTIEQVSIIEPPSATASEGDSRPGRLLIRCSPWAHVIVDSQRIDTTPMEEAAELEAGEHMLRLEHPNFPVYMKNIRIKPGEELRMAVDLDTLFGYLACNVYPWGDVYVDEEYRGQTPFAGALPVQPGQHVLVVKNQQYETVVDSFYVARQDTFVYQHSFE